MDRTKTIFEKIVIIGYGKVTGEVLSYVRERQPDYGYSLEFIEHEVHPFGITGKICEEEGIPFARIEDKKELAAYFYSIQEKTLIVSASNNYLFPRSLVEKDNITIINFHNALLPDYPGRNAPSWVIYRGEKETGITWHYVTAGIDEGNIIIQKKCAIGADTKAYELAEQLMSLAYDAFKESFDAVVTGQMQAIPQGTSPGRRMYRSCEVPADGFFEITQDAEEIYRLLRSVDYGKNEIFPCMQTVIDGKRAEVLRYRKVNAEKYKEGGGEGFLFLPLGENWMLKMKVRFM